MKQVLKCLVGDVPEGTARVKRMRQHQGWWRAFVLGVPPGDRQDGKGTVCNILPVESENTGFLTQGIRDVVDEVVKARDRHSAGAMEETRLRRNLLSSQPLCFNFFAPLYNDNVLALRILKSFFPKLSAVTAVHFEFGEKEYTKDRSAFDVAIVGKEGKKSVLIGLECKYTESFSSTAYHKAVYEQIHNASDRPERPRPAAGLSIR